MKATKIRAVQMLRRIRDRHAWQLAGKTDAETRCAPTRSRTEGVTSTGMANRITRDRMVEAIRGLPADATVDDAIERLVFLAKIEEGLAQLDRGEGVPHDEVKRRLGL